MNLLPANLASLANVCDDGTRRFCMQGVHVIFYGDNTYLAEATNGKVLIRVTAPAPADPSEYPSIPAMASAPNGATEASIPSADWARAFKSLPRGRTVKSKSILGNLAVVCSEKEVALGSTDLSQASTALSRNLLSESRYPMTSEVIPNTEPTAKVNIDARRMSDLLRALEPLTGDSCNRVTLEFHKDGGPLVIRADHIGNGQKTVALIMPLS